MFCILDHLKQNIFSRIEMILLLIDFYFENKSVSVSFLLLKIKCDCSFKNIFNIKKDIAFFI